MGEDASVDNAFRRCAKQKPDEEADLKLYAESVEFARLPKSEIP